VCHPLKAMPKVGPKLENDPAHPDDLYVRPTFVEPCPGLYYANTTHIALLYVVTYLFHLLLVYDI
jgi:hypothetical protein